MFIFKKFFSNFFIWLFNSFLISLDLAVPEIFHLIQYNHIGLHNFGTIPNVTRLPLLANEMPSEIF